MRIKTFRIAGLSAALLLSGSFARAQSLPLAPVQDSGLAVVGVYEGWFANADGTYSLLFGYFNRNQKEELDVPIGANNHIEPGGPDHGQPTHFLAGRQSGMFSINVPKDFGDKKAIWTLISNGYTSTIPAGLHPDYEISPFVEAAVGNTPPTIRFEEKGMSVQGPVGLSVQRETTVGTPLSLAVWVTDDRKRTSTSGALTKNPGPPVTLRWDKYRGDGTVTFANARPKVESTDGNAQSSLFKGEAVTTVRFSEAGEYTLHVVANDYSGDGGGGFQCCWTFGIVNVLVKP